MFEGISEMCCDSDTPERATDQSSVDDANSGDQCAAETEAPPQDESSRATSPQEAFDDLRASIEALQCDVGDLREFAARMNDYLCKDVAKHRRDGMQSALESLFQLHDALYTKVTAMVSGEDEPNTFILNCLENLQGELARHSIEVIEPKPGDKINLDVMFLAGAVHCAWWREPDRVARVIRCGFVQESDERYEVLRKADVAVYRRT